MALRRKREGTPFVVSEKIQKRVNSLDRALMVGWAEHVGMEFGRTVEKVVQGTLPPEDLNIAAQAVVAVAIRVEKEIA